MDRNTFSSYDDEFVEQSINYAHRVQELRAVRDALSIKRNALGLKKLEMSMQGADMRTVNKEILQVMVEWRKVSEEIDDLLMHQLDHIAHCRIRA